MKWILTGDTHGRVPERLATIKEQMKDFEPNETAVIILGDAGLNYWGNKTDKKNKEKCEEYELYIYCVRGNHEMRPTDVKGMITLFDENVNGLVHMEEEYPHIRYFIDGASYVIDGYNVLIIGGAYSVDKDYRLATAKANGRSFSGWFENEQLDEFEREKILEYVKDNEYDFVFSHTCPYEWMPVDLFLPMIDQSSVDKSMEEWLSEVRTSIKYGVWCFGHYHRNRIEKAYVEQYYNYWEYLWVIKDRWDFFRQHGQLASVDKWIEKSPFFYEN